MCPEKLARNLGFAIAAAVAAVITGATLEYLPLVDGLAR